MNELTQTAPLTSDTFLRSWQHASTRLLRAQERMLQGVASAARLEMRFGQELMESRLAMLNWKESRAQSPAGQTFQDVEKMIVLMHDVTEELRTGFTEAAKLLADTAQEQMQETEQAAHASLARTDELATSASEVIKDSTNKTAKLTKEVISESKPE